ncbi:energy transducer TonB [Desulfosarcina ovata]|uniref:Protein TonB n=2 Tax=Desulfosarcina ovata TaxID=83564 RepID=A0A5K8AIC1_9BACT|nr:energy transducer TonB [Desulfosarcina ovata]BBO82597.1 hypothetical protein DSCO28_31630 [Desulfosarcina ovata subsp. sediminis]BBO92435.1 hypothetical protein DSCOOX_56150 [Desulfosarcina ovata subsp. ovata]
MQDTMTRQPGNNNYFQSAARRQWATWLFSGVIAAGLNLVLFLLMPHLVDSTPSRTAMDALVPLINVVRIKRPDSPVKKQTVKPPKPPETKPVHQPDASPRRPLRAKLTLPFEINPRLPGAPNSLVLPPMESAPPVDAGALSAPFSAGQLDAPLTTLTRIPPVYPMSARRRGIEGWVKVRFVVDEHGQVGNITILAAEPAGLFERSVERCVSAWRFKPGTVSGMPVRTSVETTIRFELEQS